MKKLDDKSYYSIHVYISYLPRIKANNFALALNYQEPTFLIMKKRWSYYNLVIDLIS